jgi:hypothetical protein
VANSPKFYFILIPLLLLFAFSPYFLIISEQPVKSDAVVLFLGQESSARKKEAINLINQGLSEYLIIPGTIETLKKRDDGKLVKVGSTISLTRSMNFSHRKGNQFRVIEDTHIEAIRAKLMMDRLELKSANFVSSPYHMRRIKVIAGRVFDDEKYQISFVSTDNNGKKPFLWWLSKDGWWWVTREYSKIVWFLIYEPFTQLGLER